MQTLIKHRWAAIVSLAFTIIFGGLFFSTQTAHADGYGGVAKDCTYAFTSSEEKAIRRTNCPNDLKDLTYKDGDGTKHYYTQTSTKSSCTQTIELLSSGDDNSRQGALSGEHEEADGSCEAIDPDPNATLGWPVTVYNSDSVPVNDSDSGSGSDLVGMAGRQSYIYGKLENIVEKTCKSDTSGYCDQIALKGIYACVAESWNKIDRDESGKNTKFRNLLSHCIPDKTDLKRDDVFNALGGSVYTDTQRAGIRAVQVANTGTAGEEADTCNVSANPISWILCPIFDGIGSLSDFLLDSLVQDFLHTNPISTDPDDPVYQIWSSFRIWGNIFLIIALLVIVFGQAIGGGILDAYTAKKVLPRLLVAAILINLSIYIVALAVDVTNVIGQGVAGIINAPLQGVSLSPGGWELAIFVAVSGAAATLMGFIAVIAGPALIATTIGGAAPFLFLFIILPVFLAIFFVFLILVFRQAVILALVLVSPVAFALYCLPNTEQYFRKWWSLLLNMLMVYPIVMIIFSVANLLAYTAIMANGNNSFWGYMVAFLLQFLPLFLIPYAFKLAGGVLGRIHDIANGYGKRGVEAIKGNPNNPYSRRNKAKYKAVSGFNQTRGRIYEDLSGKTTMGADTRGARLRRRATVGLSRAVGYGNLEYERSMHNEEREKVVAAQYGTGGDNTVRAYWAKQYMGDTDANGQVIRGADGSIQTSGGRQVGGFYTYSDASGTFKEWSAADVSKAKSLVGKDMSNFQAYAKYEMSKAADDGQLEQFKDRFLELSQENGYDINEVNGVWAGDKFAHQQTRKELKHQSIAQDANGKFVWGRTSHADLSRELVDNVRKGEFSAYRSSTGKKALEGLQEAHTRLTTGFDYDGDANKDQNGKIMYKRANDEVSRQNYLALADYLEPSLFGSPQQQANAARRAQAQAQASGEGEEALGFGLGASQRGEQAWKDFVQAARAMRGGGAGPTPPPPSPGSGGPSGA